MKMPNTVHKCPQVVPADAICADGKKLASVYYAGWRRSAELQLKVQVELKFLLVVAVLCSCRLCKHSSDQAGPASSAIKRESGGGSGGGRSAADGGAGGAVFCARNQATAANAAREQAQPRRQARDASVSIQP